MGPPLTPPLRPAAVWANPTRPPAQVLSLVDLSTPIKESDFDAGEDRWQLGFSWAPESQAAGWLRDICTSGTDDTDTAFTIPAVLSYYPFYVETKDQCSTLSWQKRDFVGRATRLLALATPAALAREFWTGEKAQAAGYPNDYLANASTCIDVTPLAVPSVTRGIEILEDALATTGFGGQGMIHAQPQALGSYLTSRRTSSQLLTINETILVPDSGYDGSGPTGFTAATDAQTWIYATDIVSTIVDDGGEPLITPDSMAEAVLRDTNLITFRAQWAAAAVFDGFRHFGCRVTLDH